MLEGKQGQPYHAPSTGENISPKEALEDGRLKKGRLSESVGIPQPTLVQPVHTVDGFSPTLHTNKHTSPGRDQITDSQAGPHNSKLSLDGFTQKSALLLHTTL